MSELSQALAGIGRPMTSQEYLRRKLDALPPRDRASYELRVHIEALAMMTVENTHDVWIEQWPKDY